MEFNVEECLLRLRYGRFAWQAEQLFGIPVSAIGILERMHFLTVEFVGRREIVALVLDHGKLRPPAILSKLVLANAEGE